jgi:alpha-L-rhamnosidase
MYRYMCGINPVEDAPGFKKIRLTPKPYGKLSYAKARFLSPSGLIESGWKINEDGSLSFRFTVPFNASAELILPDANLDQVKVNGVSLGECDFRAKQDENNVICQLLAGEYMFDYIPSTSYILTYGVDIEIKDLMEKSETKQILNEIISEFVNNPIDIRYNADKTLRELAALPFGESVLTSEVLEKLDQRLRRVRR